MKPSRQENTAARAASPVNWSRFGQIVAPRRRFFLTTHVRPDCDALGSTLAMALILESQGKEATVVLGYDLPPSLRWLDPAGRVKRLGRDLSADELSQFDALIVLDTSAWAQLNHMETVIRLFAGPKLVIDHHASGDPLEVEWFRDPAAEATGRLVVEAADHLAVALTAEMATLLFAALATDTGWFRFASTDVDTYQLAARLTDSGARPDAIYAALYEKESLGRLRLAGWAMTAAQTELDGRLIHTSLELADFKKTGALASDSEDIINMTLAVGGTEAAVIFVEQAGGRFKVSLRSRCRMDSAAVAAQFGGGGHRAAAGATVEGDLDTVRRRVLDAVRKAMN